MKQKSLKINIENPGNQAKRNNKCWLGYHGVVNHPKFNKCMSAMFCATIFALFCLMVAITILRSHSAQTSRHLIPCDCPASNVSTDIGRSSNEEVNEKKCSIDEECNITCENANDDEILAEIEDFEDNRDSCFLVELTLRSCNLNNNRIRSRWLSTLDINIETLKIFESNITNISQYAFNSTVFSNLVSITIDNYNPRDENFKFVFHSRNSFAGLTRLSKFVLKNIPSIEFYDDDQHLFYVKHSLTHLEITNIEETIDLNSFYSKDVLETIVSLKLENNYFPSLNSECFSGVAENVEILEMQNSNIKTIEIGTFDEFEKLKRLYLQQNKLFYLPGDIFDKLLGLGIGYIKIEKNDWNCDCGLSDLQVTVKNHLDIFDNPSCHHPEELKGKKLKDEIELCPIRTTNDISTFNSGEPCNGDSDDDDEGCTEETVESTTDEECKETSSDDETIPTTTEGAHTTESDETDDSCSDTTEYPTEDTTEATSSTLNVTDSSSISATDSTESTTSTETSTDPTTTTTEITTTTTEPNDPYQTFNIECSKNTLKVNRNISWETDGESRENLPIFGREHDPDLNNTIKLVRPKFTFEFVQGNSNSEIMIRFERGTLEHYPGMFLIYYPGSMMSNDVTNENVKKNVLCRIIVSEETLINELQASTIYTFCAILRYQLYISPFQCKSNHVNYREPWLYEEHKVVILTSFMIVLMLVLIIGIIGTFILIRKIPTLMRGSKRVVVVKNRHNRSNVMVMPSEVPRASCTSHHSHHSQSDVASNSELPAYLTPLPRKMSEVNHSKSALHRSASDSSIKSSRSYLSVSRSPPRFSQVVRQDCDQFRAVYPACRHGSISTFSSPSDIPPPLPRRSISSGISAVDLRKRSQNSIYKQRQPSRIDDETENHYNFII